MHEHHFCNLNLNFSLLAEAKGIIANITNIDLKRAKLNY
jgi:hypothetical protein